MLVELVVENYAVVERLRVGFHAGLNLLTGETGSGKSIIVDALGLLFGGRASTEAVRTGASAARISGIFQIPPDPRAAALFESAGLELEDDEILIEREIQASGKSRAFAGSRPVSAGFLKDLAALLGDIHGQHDQQLLFSTDSQRELLDAYGGLETQLAEVSAAYREWRACQSELDRLERDEKQKLQLLDLWTFQKKEIEQAAPVAGEDTELEQERRVLLNLTRLQESAAAGYDALYDSPQSALTQIRAGLDHLEELCRIDPKLDETRQMLAPAAIAIEEAGLALRDYLSHLEADPARLEHVESRLSLLDRLKRKYGGGLEEIVVHLEKVTAEIDAIENADEHRARLRKKLDALATTYEAAAGRLSEARKKAARRLEAAIVTELESLAMGKSRFGVQFGTSTWTESGSDELQYLFSANVGEELRPLEKVASGGELSRIALALKTCLARPAGTGGFVRTLVFDEVDAGIGGKAAESVGRRLKDLAAYSQVLCVTHQPQIAGYADHHYHVEKIEESGRTVARLIELGAAERVKEIGRMLSGDRLTPEALRHAEQLIELSRQTAGASR